MSETLLTVYSTVWCGYCQRLKKQLAQQGINFVEIDIEENPEAAQIVEQVNEGNRTVPTLVFADGKAMTNPSIQTVISKLDELESNR